MPVTTNENLPSRTSDPAVAALGLVGAPADARGSAATAFVVLPLAECDDLPATPTIPKQPPHIRINAPIRIHGHTIRLRGGWGTYGGGG
ncbi:hypothetical protein [Nocardia macrotermitis]|uniref:Uncharacterized protein n=1 Tax=Nocardia macrotermitis TaxID=2585198 RepID=A0A7K0CZJ2_9NOCA|nr:hypothetical protein [Nocardia macrotermitis]MQY18094.1 hypothetical protein [Nocardia macrotermitis]